MNEMMIISTPQGGKYLPPPDPAGYQFLASASNSMNPDLAGSRGQTSSSGVSKVTLYGHDVVKSNNGHISYNYGLNLSAFRRGAEIDAVVYVDRQNDRYPDQIHPTLVGFMVPDSGLNYWSFGLKLVGGKLRVCFYGWNGEANPMSGAEDIKSGWHLISYRMDIDGIHLYLDGTEVFFRPVSDSQLSDFIRSQGAASVSPLSFFKNSGGITNTNTAWISIK